jgi:DNA-binding response OmpR family regulator
MEAPRVLLVEDDIRLRDIIARCLREGGYAVEMASNGGAAFDLAKAVRFAALVTDARMPVMAGPDLIHALRREQPDLPCLLLSGDGDFGAQGLPEDVLTLGKPFKPDELLQLMRELVRSGRT